MKDKIYTAFTFSAVALALTAMWMTLSDNPATLEASRGVAGAAIAAAFGAMVVIKDDWWA